MFLTDLSFLNLESKICITFYKSLYCGVGIGFRNFLSKKINNEFKNNPFLSNKENQKEQKKMIY